MLSQSKKATFTLSAHMINELSGFAEELGAKKSHIVSEALDRYFDILDLQLAKKRSAEIHNGDVETVSLEQIRAELGL